MTLRERASRPRHRSTRSPTEGPARTIRTASRPRDGMWPVGGSSRQERPGYSAGSGRRPSEYPKTLANERVLQLRAFGAPLRMLENGWILRARRQPTGLFRPGPYPGGPKGLRRRRQAALAKHPEARSRDGMTLMGRASRLRHRSDPDSDRGDKNNHPGRVSSPRVCVAKASE
jgi:hypothetical protein